MKKPLMVGAALALVVAVCAGVKPRTEKPDPQPPKPCAAPECLEGGTGGGKSRITYDWW